MGHYDGTTTSELAGGFETTIGLASSGTSGAPQAVVRVMAWDVAETPATAAPS